MLAVMEDPHQLREAGCTHTFCKACLEQALGAEGAARCPVCRAGAGVGAPATLVTRAVVTAATIESLEVHCPHGVRQAQHGADAEAAWELRAVAVGFLLTKREGKLGAGTLAPAGGRTAGGGRSSGSGVSGDSGAPGGARQLLAPH